MLTGLIISGSVLALGLVAGVIWVVKAIRQRNASDPFLLSDEQDGDEKEEEVQS
jgi:hypothetical protein